MSFEVRPCEPEELLSALAPISHYFGRAGTPTEEYMQGVVRVLPPERMHAAFDGDAIVAGAGAFPFDVTVPGGPVRAAGVTVVGVLPTHRRRGILRRLMRAQLDAVHERGEPIAVLWASEGGIYGRFGYGVASLGGDIELPRTHAAFARPVDWEGAARLVPVEEAYSLLPAVYDHVRLVTPGMLSRSAEWWRARVLADPEWRRAGAGELACAVLEQNGRPEAYALYRVNFGFTDGLPSGVTRAVEAMGLSPGATAAVWRYLLDLDWVERVEALHLPLDHPLFLLLEEPSYMRFRVGDVLWLRLVDVGAALSERAYVGDGDLVLGVTDPFCPWNDACFRLDGSKTRDEPHLRLSVDALGSAYLGGFTFAQLAAAGRVEEVVDGAVARADALFRTDRAPWCPEIF